MKKNNTVLTIFKKELFRFFKDKRTMSAIILPGILIYVMYSFMGTAMSDAFVPDEDYVPTVYSENTPASFNALCDMADITLIDSTDAEAEKSKIKDDEADLLIVFPENFDELVSQYSTNLGVPAPNVEIYYNSSSTNSSMTFSTVTALLDAYESSMANKFDVNNSIDKTFDLAGE